MEKGKGQEMVLSRNVPELKQDLHHSEAEQGKREEQKRLDQVVVARTTTSDEDSEAATTEMGDAKAATI